MTAAVGTPPGTPLLGHVPMISVIAATGLLLVAVGDSLGRAGAASADVVFWAGIALIVLPCAVRLVHPSTDRGERIGVLVVMGMALYIVKLFHSPTSFTFYDEIQHLRTAQDLALTGHLFGANPLLLVSPLYPGLEVVTNALATATDTSTFQAGLVVVGAARLMLVLGLFLVFEQVTRSDRIAGVAAFVYMANPNFLFFDAQFAYESLGIGLIAVVLYLTALSKGRWRAGAGAAVIAVAAVIVTHHISTYALIAFLVTWTVTWRLVSGRDPTAPGPARLALIATVGAVAWLLLIAPQTIEYLGGRFTDLLALVSLLLGDITSRPLFQLSGGGLAPEWEQIVAFGSVILLLLALPIGLWRLWRSFRHDATAIALGLTAMLYPVTLVLRLTQEGAEEAGRSSGFIFFGVALVVALAVTRPWPVPGSLARLGRPAFAAAALTIVVGGAIIGVPRWSRIPGPYLAGADTRSVEAQGIGAAEWALAYLGPDRRVVADRVNRLLMGVYGRQRTVTNFADQVRTFNLFFDSTFDDADRSLLERGDVEYLVIDKRLIGVRPLAGSYYESGEPREIAQTGGLTMQGLVKFERVPGVDKVFDSGDMVIYDVRAVTTGVRP